MLVGYARVSTQDQNPDLQLDALPDFTVEEVGKRLAAWQRGQVHGLGGWARCARQ